MAIIGYARVSTVEQEAGFNDQLAQLEAAGCEKIFSERVSSVAQRDKLEQAIEYVREGDTFVVTKLDRLARSISHFTKILDSLERKKVGLKILSLNIDTSTPTGKMLMGIVSSIAEWEREMMLERQKIGIEAAKRLGKYKGRQPLPDAVRASVLADFEAGCSGAQTAKKHGISARTAFSIKAAAKSASEQKTNI